MLTDNYKQLEQFLHDEDCDQESFISALEAIQADINEKAINYGFLIKNLSATVTGIEEAIELMNERKKGMESKIDQLKQSVVNSMCALDLKKIESGWFNLSVLESKRVIIDDELKLKPEFVVKEETIRPDKKALKEYMDKNGVLKMEGAHIEIGRSLQIK
jgi:hypothetical protein